MSDSSHKTIILTLVLHFLLYYPLLSMNIIQNSIEFPEAVSFLVKGFNLINPPIFLSDFNFILTNVGYSIVAFTVKEISFVSMFFLILLLALWYYRRYELRRINNIKRDLRVDVKSKEQPPSNQVASNVTSPEQKKMFYCLFCLLKNRYENIIVADNHINGLNGWHKLSDEEKDSFFISGLNKDTFCDFLCMVNRKCYFPVNVLAPYANKADPSIEFDYSSEIMHYNHFEASSYEDNTLKPADTNNQQLSFKFLQPPVPVFSSYDQTFLRRIGEIVELNYTDTNFSVEQLANELNLSVSQVNRRLKALTDYPAGQLLRVFRLHRAAGLIFAKADSVSEICFNTGFNSQPYFSRAFKKQFGYSPTVYRKLVTEKSMYLR